MSTVDVVVDTPGNENPPEAHRKKRKKRSQPPLVQGIAVPHGSAAPQHSPGLAGASQHASTVRDLRAAAVMAVMDATEGPYIEIDVVPVDAEKVGLRWRACVYRDKYHVVCATIPDDVPYTRVKSLLKSGDIEAYLQHGMKTALSLLQKHLDRREEV